jgi:excinuclease UvrABC helicase subunit UvrB
MEQMTLEATINEIAAAYAALDNAKSDCKDVIESALDSYFGSGEMDDKFDKARQRTEAKNIKKLAKMMAKGAKNEAKEEAENMTDLIEALG